MTKNKGKKCLEQTRDICGLNGLGAVKDICLTLEKNQRNQTECI